MANLPKSFCETAGLADNSTVSNLLEQLSAKQNDALDGLLTSEDSQLAVSVSLENLHKYRLRIEDQVGPWQFKFCSVNVGNYSDPVLVGLISDAPIEGLPTELENLVFWALIDVNLPWHQSICIDVADPHYVDWRSLAKGKAIIAEPSALNLNSTSQQLISALFGLSYPSMPPTPFPGPIISSATSLKIDFQLDRLTAIQSQLLLEASYVQHPKWRFLSFYRILENAYLSNIKEVLLSEFDTDASKAIESAKSKLASEVNQLVHLAERGDITTEFEVFNNEVDGLIAAGNQYTIALDRAAKSESLYSAREPYKKAVLRFYKVRCSIAHAGTSSVIYEQFLDANSAILKLLPLVEAIALKSLKITSV